MEIGEARIRLTADTTELDAKLDTVEGRVRSLRDQLRELAVEFADVIPPIAQRLHTD
jgi:chaperonin cofactor prefoldin